MVNIGFVYLSKGEYDKVLRYYFKAQRIYEQLGLQNTKSYATTMYIIGIVYKVKGDMTTAREYLYKARDIFKRIGREDLVREVEKHLK
jgi:tetratricopeptide (TPR) repeat protein